MGFVFFLIFLFLGELNRMVPIDNKLLRVLGTVAVSPNILQKTARLLLVSNDDWTGTFTKEPGGS